MTKNEITITPNRPFVNNLHKKTSCLLVYLVRERGLEPPSLSAQAPQACVSTNFTTRAKIFFPDQLSCLFSSGPTLFLSSFLLIAFHLLLPQTVCLPRRSFLQKEKYLALHILLSKDACPLPVEERLPIFRL